MKSTKKIPKITEGDEVDFPTFELASNDQFDTKIPGWPWIGNFARLPSQWEGVKHFNKKSFLLWSQKNGATPVKDGEDPWLGVYIFMLNGEIHWIESRVYEND